MALYKNLVKRTINAEHAAGTLDRTATTDRMDTLLANGKLTQNEYAELTVLLDTLLGTEA